MNKYQKKKNSPKQENSSSTNKRSPKENSGFKKRDTSSERDFKKKPYEKKPFGKPGRFSKSDDRKDERSKSSERTPASFRKKDSSDYKPREEKRRSSSDRGDFKKKPYEKKPYEKKSFGKPGRFSKPDDRKDERSKSSERTPASFRKKDSSDYKPREEKRRSSSDRGDFKKKPYEKKSFGKPGRFSKPDDRKDERGKSAERTPASFRKKDSSDYKPREEKRNSFERDSKKKPYEKKPSGKRSSSFEKPPVAPDYNLKKSKGTKNETASSSGQIRLNKYIANSGICSRREADKLIEEGLIKVNDIVVTELGYKVNKSDIVRFENRILNREKLVYVLLNKPKDFITTMDDPQDRKTVMALVSSACKERIYPVGRLDRNTTGLLLLTNDGELADKLTHPSNEVKKIYQVDIDKPISNDDFDKIINGLELEDGPVKVDQIAIVSSDKKSFGLEIHQGRNRIVRRIFEHLGYDVVRLDRVMYAGLTKKDLARGQWRFLTEKEVIHLKHF